jgi:aminoglycoside 2'-N-acetyltransferase I
MSPEPVVRVAATAALSADERVGIRTLLDAAFDGEFGEDDWAHALGGLHAVVESDGVVVAHASVVRRVLDAGGRALQVGYVEAVGVLPARQGTGLGTAVMRALAPIVERDVEVGALSSGEWHFYERLGWERWRGPTWVRFPDGRRERTSDDDDSLMILRTPRTPALDLSAPLTCESRPGDAW